LAVTDWRLWFLALMTATLTRIHVLNLTVGFQVCLILTIPLAHPNSTKAPKVISHQVKYCLEFRTHLKEFAMRKALYKMESREFGEAPGGTGGAASRWEFP